MNKMISLYYEETYELLQDIEDYLIRLENEVVVEDINGLFRCIHSIKGSSAVVGFKEITSLAHKVEDMLNHIRNGKMNFDKSTTAICFSALDEITKFVNLRRESDGEEDIYINLEKSEELEKEIENLVSKIENKPEEDKNIAKIPESSVDMSKILNYSNSYFMSLSFESNDPMPSIRRFLLYNLLIEIGAIVYSNPPIKVMIDPNNTEEIFSYECIVKTNISEDKLVKQVDVGYVKDIRVIDINRKHLVENEMRVSLEDIKLFDMLLLNNEYDNNPFTSMKNVSKEAYNSLMRRIYKVIKNKVLFKAIELENDFNNLDKLTSIENSFNKNNFKYLFIDISKVELLEIDEIKCILRINKSLLEDNIKLYLINKGKYKRRLYNIFEAIKDIEHINLCEKDPYTVLWGGELSEEEL